MKSIIDQNNLKGGTYIEPFSGGAAIALALAIDGYMERIVINDYDRSIYAFWHSILYHTDTFIDKIRNGIHNKQFNKINKVQICLI